MSFMRAGAWGSAKSLFINHRGRIASTIATEISKIKMASESTRTMRVLQILHTYERGGILTLASMIETGLAAHGCHVETEILFRTPERSGAGKIADAFRMALRK